MKLVTWTKHRKILKAYFLFKGVKTTLEVANDPISWTTPKRTDMAQNLVSDEQLQSLNKNFKLQVASL